MKKSDFLVAENSFFIGMSRILDLGSTINKKSYNFSDSEEEADKVALLNDWEMIGQDMRNVMNEQRKKLQPR